MKAIDRAATWTRWLEEVGFDIECETKEIAGSEYLMVWARKGLSTVTFSIKMNTPRTRFVCGSVGFASLGEFTNKPSEMSSRVSSEVMMENYRMQRAVSA